MSSMVVVTPDPSDRSEPEPEHGHEAREFAKAFRRFLDWVHSTPDWGAPEN